MRCHCLENTAEPIPDRRVYRMRLNLNVTMWRVATSIVQKVSYQPGSKHRTLRRLHIPEQCFQPGRSQAAVSLGARIQEAWPPVPIGLVFGVILLANGGASHVSAHLTVVPSVVLYFTAIELACRASSYLPFYKYQFAQCECTPPKFRFTIRRRSGGKAGSILSHFSSMYCCCRNCTSALSHGRHVEPGGQGFLSVR